MEPHPHTLSVDPFARRLHVLILVRLGMRRRRNSLRQSSTLVDRSTMCHRRLLAESPLVDQGSIYRIRVRPHCFRLGNHLSNSTSRSWAIFHIVGANPAMKGKPLHSSYFYGI